MEKTVKIEYTENVKSVVANTKIEYTFRDGETPLTNAQILDESKELFNQATEFSKTKTVQKMM